MTEKYKPIVNVVAAAIFDRDGRVLMAQRPENSPHAGLWEFPGGKIEAGETPEEALCRELFEELRIEPCNHCLQPFSFASYAYEDFHLLMPLFLCREWDGIATPQDGQTLKWVYPSAIRDLPLVPADIDLASQLASRISDGKRFE